MARSLRLELAPIALGGARQDVVQGQLLLLLPGRLFAVAGLAGFLRNREPGLLGEVAHGLDEAHAVLLHQEADRVAVDAAAEAVVGLARRE